MTLSSFLLRPAETSVISGGVTDSVITASPAILLGYHAGGLITGATNTTNYYYDFQIKNGSTPIIIGTTYPNYPDAGLNQIASGIDCPNGIKLSTSANFSGGSSALALARFSIFYILK